MRFTLKQAGFTLMELIIVMAMIGIVSSATLKLIRFSDIHKELTLATVELKGAVRTAQALALAPPLKTNVDKVIHICGFGIRAEADSDALEIFYMYPSDNEINKCRTIKKTDTEKICGGGFVCEKYESKFFKGFGINQDGGAIKIFFKSPYGEVVGNGLLTIKQNSSGYSKSIMVNGYGKINEQ
jgi:prepilin-type N-terminal cleavage/methylation domain-containing protein